MALEEYARKRKFAATPEPRGGARNTAKARALSFVVQLHHASVRHYDFRLELGGVLRSWAVPKGPSFRLGEKRLAVEVEDHPIDYAAFEGVIPRGNYGAGHVAIFDAGTWLPLGDPEAGIKAGKLEFEMRGKKLKGMWKLIRTAKAASKPQWLLFKRDDAFAGDFEADDLITESAVGSASAKVKPGSKVKVSSEVKAANPARAATARAKAKAKASVDPSALITEAAQLAGARRVRGVPEKFLPMLTTAVAKAPLGDEWLHEWKWDGYRLTAVVAKGKVTISSRNGLDWHQRLPDLVNALRALNADCAVDGELVCLDERGRSDFNALQRALKAGETSKLNLVLFDMPRLGNVDLTEAALVDRKALLHRLIAGRGPQLGYSDHIIGHGDKVFAEARRQQLEGIISKRVTSTYVSGRGKAWVKVKVVDTREFVIVGYTRPRGSRVGLGALLLAEPEGNRWKYVGRVGSGLADAQLQALLKELQKAPGKAVVELPAHVDLAAREISWVEPRMVVEVLFRGWGKEGLLRQASFLRLRDDRKLDATLVQPEAVSPDAVPAPSSPGRIVFPDAGITKQQVFDYYLEVADRLLAEIGGRPLSIVRCPDGIVGQHFFQKHAGPGFGDAVRRFKLKEKDGDRAEYFFVDDLAGLMNLVQMNAIEFHPWGSRVDTLEKPDRMVFDLDPDAAVQWPDIKRAAVEVRDRLRAIGLESFPKLSGGKGLHVVVPLAPGADWDEVRTFCESFATAMASEQPERYTATMSKAKRKGRIFIDWLRNGRGATSIASWSLRARAGAPASVPIEWEELSRVRSPNRYTLRTAGDRTVPNLIAKLEKLEQRLPTFT